MNLIKYRLFIFSQLIMFAIIAAIGVMFGLSLARVPVVFALVIGAVTGGLLAGLGLQGTLDAFNNGLGGGAKIALAYGVLGAFALALARSGLPDLLAYKLVSTLKGDANVQSQNKVKFFNFLYDCGCRGIFAKPDSCSYCFYPGFDSAVVKCL